MTHHGWSSKVSPTIAMAAMLLAGNTILAQQPAPPGTDLAAFAARRHPQPVRVADLIGRAVLEPLESRPVLGHVKQVVRLNDGLEKIIVIYGGWLGFGGRDIAVPLQAMVLVGDELEILDFTREQLKSFQTYDGSSGKPLSNDAFISMGLAHPSH